MNFVNKIKSVNCRKIIEGILFILIRCWFPIVDVGLFLVAEIHLSNLQEGFPATQCETRVPSAT